MHESPLAVDVRDRIAFLTLARPEVHNALNDQAIEALGAAAARIAGEPGIAGAIVTGAGKAFSVGADVRELAGQGPQGGRARALRGQAALGALRSAGKPVVAAVNGFALGGGCELALACHLRVASDAAVFGQPEVRLGLVPGFGGTQRLPRLIGRGGALALLLTGDRIDAAEAYRIGLVDRVVPGAVLLAEAEALLRRILTAGPLAVRAVLDLVERGLDMTLADALAEEAAAFGLLSATGDMTEGIAAFLARRPPRFRGA